MATYKVLQDIEAEDKLLGPLSLRQFIYAIICIMFLFVGWQMSRIQIVIGIPMLLPAAFFGLLAAPLGANQSSEIWLLAKIRFFFKPRRRIWNQTGLMELVTITVPKKIEHQFTNNLSQTEVKSRLQALANTIDSRGWAIKNVNINLSAQPGYLMNQSSDRLIDVSAMPQEVANYEVTANDDILDAQNNPTAQHLDQMINASTKAHREEIVEHLRQSVASTGALAQDASNPPPDYWFMNQTQASPPPGQAVFGSSPVVAPASEPIGPIAAATPTPEEEALIDTIREKHLHKGNAYGHMKTLQPIGEAPVSQPVSTPAPQSAADPQGNQTTDTSAKTTDAGIISLANNDDLDVATIARQAKKSQDHSSDEVVISLR